MDFLSKIVSGNIDRIKRNISNSFVQDLDIQKGFDDELEKGKWSVGDTKVYQGVTWEVGGFNAKGAPLWRKAKGGAGGGAASSQNNTTASTKTSDDSEQSSSKQTNKYSSFVTKTIDDMKKVLEWKSIPNDEFEKLADAISNDEETAKNILSIKFPETNDVSPKSDYSKESKIVDIGDYDMVCQTSKRFEYVYRSSGTGRSPNITTQYYIALKDPKIHMNRWMGNSSFSTFGYNKQTKSEAKKQCVMLALYHFYIGGFVNKKIGKKKSENKNSTKKNSGGSNSSSIQSKNQQNVSANNSSTAQNNSNDVKKLKIDIDSDKIGSLLATFYKYGTKEDYQKKLQALQVLIDPSSNKEFWDHAFKVVQEKINKKDDGQS